MNDKNFDIVLVKQPINELRRNVTNCIEYFFKHKSADGSCDKAVMKTFCRMVYDMLCSRFVNGLYIVEKTKRRLSAGMNSDNEIILKETYLYAFSVAADLNSRMEDAIPLSDFPTCKHLLSMEKDVLKKSLKEINDNPMMRRLANFGAVAKDSFDAITIIKVFVFYKRYIDEIEREIKEEQWNLCEWEQWLLDKANAECGYCYLALLELGLSVPKDIIDAVDDIKADSNIKHYETKWQTIENQYLTYPTLSR